MNNHVSSVTLHYDQYPSKTHYPFSLSIFNKTRQRIFNSPVTFFVGENGTGKSTLLEAIALACNIHIWERSDSVRFQANRFEKQFFKFLTVHWANGSVPGAYFGSEIFNDFRKIVEGWAASDPGQLEYFGGKSLIAQSHGQSMMAYFGSRYKIQGIYFLDEPETALSPRSQLKLLDILKENSELGHAQFIIATHSPILLSYENAEILSFDKESVQFIGYRETDHYQIYKNFLADR